MPNHPMTSTSIVSSAVDRAKHLSQALAMYETILQSPAFAETFSQVVQTISTCATESSINQLHFSAIGKSGDIARLAVSMFMSVGIAARFLHPIEAFHGDLGSVRAQDICILISNSGEVAELITLAPHLRDRRCHLIAITGRPSSRLASLSDVVLALPSYPEACPLQQAPITSTLTTLAMCHLLVAATVESRAYPLEKYALNHPGGAIGRRIALRVDDVMIKGDALPEIDLHAAFPECVSAMTRFGFGALLVRSQGRFVGLIAERDLRRSMQEWGAEVFMKSAADLMNPRPITLECGVLAVDAFRLMEDRPHPLSILPIVDSDKHPIGLLRIHDLVAAGLSLHNSQA